jgi:hypothetical protein
MFYEAQQLSFYLWERPDGLTEGSGGDSGRLQPDYEPLPTQEDDPFPRLLRECRRRPYGSPVSLRSSKP